LDTVQWLKGAGAENGRQAMQDRKRKLAAMSRIFRPIIEMNFDYRTELLFLQKLAAILNLSEAVL